MLQGAILSPLFFSLYINDVVESADANFNLFADDTSVYLTDESPAALQSRLQALLDKLSLWFKSWAVTVNNAKSAVMLISRRRNLPALNVQLDGTAIPQVVTHKHLGLMFNNRLCWNSHTDYVRKKAAKKIGFLRRIRRRLPCLVIRSLYMACIRPTLEYAGEAWVGIGKSDSNRLEKCQRAAARLIAKVSLKDNIPHDLLLAHAGLESLSTRRSLKIVSTVYRLSSAQPKSPPHLLKAFQDWLGTAPDSESSMTLRSAERESIRLPRPRTELLRLSPFYHGVSVLNSCPAEAKVSLSSLKSHFLSSAASP